jgi:archaellum component FlaC
MSEDNAKALLEEVRELRSELNDGLGRLERSIDGVAKAISGLKPTMRKVAREMSSNKDAGKTE